MNAQLQVIGPPIRRTKKATVYGRLATFPLYFLPGLQAATQYAAYQFSYHSSLGRPLVHSFYAPWRIAQWTCAWSEQRPEVLQAAMSVGVLVAGVEMLAVIGMRTAKANAARPSLCLHGSARWAKSGDLEEAGLLGQNDNPARAGRSIYIGGWRDEKGVFHYLRHSGSEHVLVLAPTRSGKGVGIVLPTLLSWIHSVVALDLKGELWALTAGWRKQHAKNRVLKFEPSAAAGSVCWNPLEEVRLGTESEVGDVQNLVTMLVCPDGGDMESHWQKTSFALLVGVILHALYKCRNEGTVASLPMIDGMLADPQKSAAALYQEMISYRHVNGANHPTVGRAGRDQIDRADEEAGSVLSTAKSYLSLYRDPVIAANVSRSEFRIRDLMNADSPASLFIVPPPSNKDRLRPLIRLLLDMIVRILAFKLKFEDGKAVPTYKHRLLMMLDEFPSMKKLPLMEESLSYVAGFGITMCLIAQDKAQIEKEYGDKESISSNCHVQCAFQPNKLDTAKHLSGLTGEATAIKEQITESGKSWAPFSHNVTRTFQEVKRPLLTPDECMRMRGPKKRGELIKKAGDMLVYVAGYPAVYGEQPLYFKDKIFAQRARVKAPAETDRLQVAESKKLIVL